MVISDLYIALKSVLQIWENYHTKYDVKDPLQDALLDWQDAIPDDTW